VLRYRDAAGAVQDRRTAVAVASVGTLQLKRGREITMKRSRSPAYSVVLVGLLFAIPTHDAHAYIDPGSGSYIIQLIIAGLLGAAFAVRIYWKRIKAFLSNLLSKGQEE
jgi:hypothetical protein